MCHRIRRLHRSLKAAQISQVNGDMQVRRGQCAHSIRCSLLGKATNANMHRSVADRGRNVNVT